MPSTYSHQVMFLHDFVAQNADAVLKSAEILSRGFQALHHNLDGTANMTFNDGVSAARALMDRRAVSEWIALHAELVRLNSGRAAIRALLLSVMTVQLAEEALFPLIRRMNASFGLAARTMAA